MRKALFVGLFAALCLIGLILMILSKCDEYNDIWRSGLPLISAQGWAFAYEERHERSLAAKVKVWISLALQTIFGIMLCIIPFVADNTICSVPFWLALIGAVIWTICSVLLSCALYDAD